MLPPAKKFEVYDRVVTIREAERAGDVVNTRGKTAARSSAPENVAIADDSFDVKKDVWYKLRLKMVGWVTFIPTT